MSVPAIAATSAYGLLLSSAERVLERSEGALALLLLEIDGIAEMRARAGFEASERLIAEIDGLLRAAVRRKDEVIRFGDASFAILVSGVRNSGHAVLAAEKMRRVTHERIAFAGLAARPVVHIGIALQPGHAANVPELVHKAQLAMASAGRRGRPVQVFEDSCADQVRRDWKLEQEFAASLESGEIEMHFQPKVRIADRTPIGAEALMRWMRDAKPVVGPDVFIPLAEDAGLTLPTTLYAMNASIRQAASWPVHVQPLSVAVNVSPGMFQQRDFVEIVSGALATWRLDPARLALEITEGVLVTDLDRTTSMLNTLRGMGVRVSIDDFGTGYSSLSYFKKIPADELKIDQSFVMRMLRDEADASIVGTIIALARRFNLRVVAEGVEDEATLQALERMGCDYAQGFLFAPALPQAEFAAWLGQARKAAPIRRPAD